MRLYMLFVKCKSDADHMTLVYLAQVSKDDERLDGGDDEDDGDADVLLPTGFADACLELFVFFTIFHAEEPSLRTLTAVP